MKSQSTKISFIVFLFLFVLIYGLFAAGYYPSSDRPVKQSSIDAYMIQSTTTEYNTQGLIDKIVFTPRLTHHKFSTATYLDQPRIHLFTQHRIPWYIQAAQGETISHSNKLILWHHVILKQFALHQSTLKEPAKTTINTEHLVYYPKRKQAISDTYTTLTQSGTFASGQYVTVHFDTGDIQIKQQTHGIYHPSLGEK